MKKQTRQIDVLIKLEARELENGDKTIAGILPYNSLSQYMGFYEIITPSAFTKTLADGADVKALIAHDNTKILGSTRSGTLKLTSTPDGLECICVLPKTTYANDVHETIKRGDCPGMSFRFDAIQEKTSYESGKEVRSLLEVKLYEVSFAVAFPAYEATNSEARELRGIDLDKLETILEKDPPSFTAEDRSALANVNKTISALIEPMPEPRTVAVPDTTAADFAASLLAASKGKE